jgi:hypothetical protein
MTVSMEDIDSIVDKSHARSRQAGVQHHRRGLKPNRTKTPANWKQWIHKDTTAHLSNLNYWLAIYPRSAHRAGRQSDPPATGERD